jgi:beta-phosphoglucomutase
MSLTIAQPRAVLWDLDGTLIDTAPVHWRAWQQILVPEGVNLTWAVFAPTFGQRNDTVLRGWIREDLADSEIARISETKEALYREMLGQYPLVLLPGAAHWLAQLHASGWRQALATMTGRKNLEAIFSVMNFQRYMDAIVCAEDVARGKPDPEVFLRAAERLSIPPQRCIVVEDSPAGIEAAKRAGMHSIGVSKDDPLPADRTAPSLADLPAATFDDLVR